MAGVLMNPTLEIFEQASGTLLITNDNWADDPQAGSISNELVPNDPLESAIRRSLAPGAYTAIVRGADAGTGVAIVEVFAE